MNVNSLSAITVLGFVSKYFFLEDAYQEVLGVECANVDTHILKNVCIYTTYIFT